MSKHISLFLMLTIIINGITPAYPAEDSLRPLAAGSSPSQAELEKELSARKFHGPIVIISVHDIAAEVEKVTDKEGKQKAQIVCRNAIEKIKRLLPVLRRQGADTIYLHGLLAVSDLSRLLHSSRWDSGQKKMVQIDRVTASMGYPTKRTTYQYGDTTVEATEKFGNYFSIMGQDTINNHLSPETDGSLSAVSLKKDLKELIEYAHQLGFKVIGCFIPWLSPDAVTDENYQQFLHRQLSKDEEGLSDEALLEKCDRQYEIERQYGIGKAYRYFILRVGPERKRILILLRNDAHDQARPNIFNPQLQRNFLDAFKFWIDSGLDGFRVDLAFELTKDYYCSFFNPFLTEKERDSSSEPFKEILDEACRHAKDRYRKNLLIALEAYSMQDRDLFTSGWGYSVYYPDPFTDYLTLALSDTGAPSDDLYRSIEWALKSKPHSIMYPSNYDEVSFSDIGGPQEPFKALLMAMSLLGVPVLLTMREWMGLGGEMVPVAGGDRDERGIYVSHRFLSQEEFERRDTFEKQMQLVEDSSWAKVLEAIRRIAPPKEESREQLLNCSNRREVIPLSWRTESGDLAILIADLRKGTKDYDRGLLLTTTAEGQGPNDIWFEVPALLAQAIEKQDKYELVTTGPVFRLSKPDEVLPKPQTEMIQPEAKGKPQKFYFRMPSAPGSWQILVFKPAKSSSAGSGMNRREAIFRSFKAAIAFALGKKPTAPEVENIFSKLAIRTNDELIAAGVIGRVREEFAAMAGRIPDFLQNGSKLDKKSLSAHWRNLETLVDLAREQRLALKRLSGQPAVVLDTIQRIFTKSNDEFLAALANASNNGAAANPNGSELSRQLKIAAHDPRLARLRFLVFRIVDTLRKSGFGDEDVNIADELALARRACLKGDLDDDEDYWKQRLADLFRNKVQRLMPSADAMMQRKFGVPFQYSDKSIAEDAAAFVDVLLDRVDPDVLSKASIKSPASFIHTMAWNQERLLFLKTCNDALHNLIDKGVLPNIRPLTWGWDWTIEEKWRKHGKKIDVEAEIIRTYLRDIFKSEKDFAALSKRLERIPKGILELYARRRKELLERLRMSEEQFRNFLKDEALATNVVIVRPPLDNLADEIARIARNSRVSVCVITGGMGRLRHISLIVSEAQDSYKEIPLEKELFYKLRKHRWPTNAGPNSQYTLTIPQGATREEVSLALNSDINSRPWLLVNQNAVALGTSAETDTAGKASSAGQGMTRRGFLRTLSAALGVRPDDPIIAEIADKAAPQLKDLSADVMTAIGQVGEVRKILSAIVAGIGKSGEPSGEEGVDILALQSERLHDLRRLISLQEAACKAFDTKAPDLRAILDPLLATSRQEFLESLRAETDQGAQDPELQELKRQLIIGLDDPKSAQMRYWAWRFSTILKRLGYSQKYFDFEKELELLQKRPELLDNQVLLSNHFAERLQEISASVAEGLFAPMSAKAREKYGFTPKTPSGPDLENFSREIANTVVWSTAPDGGGDLGKVLEAKLEDQLHDRWKEVLKEAVERVMGSTNLGYSPGEERMIERIGHKEGDSFQIMIGHMKSHLETEWLDKGKGFDLELAVLRRFYRSVYKAHHYFYPDEGDHSATVAERLEQLSERTLRAFVKEPHELVLDKLARLSQPDFDAFREAEPVLPIRAEAEVSDPLDTLIEQIITDASSGPVLLCVLTDANGKFYEIIKEVNGECQALKLEPELRNRLLDSGWFSNAKPNCRYVVTIPQGLKWKMASKIFKPEAYLHIWVQSSLTVAPLAEKNAISALDAAA